MEGDIITINAFFGLCKNTVCKFHKVVFTTGLLCLECITMYNGFCSKQMVVSSQQTLSADLVFAARVCTSNGLAVMHVQAHIFSFTCIRH